MLRTVPISFALALVGSGIVACDKKDEARHGFAEGGGATIAPLPTTAPAPPTAASQRPSADGAKDPLAEADADMRDVLDELRTLGEKPIETLSAEEARKQPSPADGVRALLKREGKSVAPEMVGKVLDSTIPTPAGALPIRVYTPKQGKGPFPVVVYFHGGGFVVGSNDGYDATPRALANAAGAVVVAVEYRKAPENKFPGAHDDAYAAYLWVLANGGSIGGDPTNVAVAGESAGGNLAANVAIRARDEKQPQPKHALLVYPLASTDTNSESYVKYANAKPLNKAMLSWFIDKYFRTSADAADPRMDLVNAKLAGLPPTTIINAEIDPLLSDGELLAKRLKAAEVPVEQKTYSGMTHEFFGMGAVVDDAKDAVEYAAKRLKSAFSEAKSRGR
jgi:acetyl esterase/lipase